MALDPEAPTEDFFDRIRTRLVGHDPIDPLVRGDELRAAGRSKVSRSAADHQERSFERPERRRPKRKLLTFEDDKVVLMSTAERAAETPEERNTRHHRQSGERRRRKRQQRIALIAAIAATVVLALIAVLHLLNRAPQECLPPGCAP